MSNEIQKALDELPPKDISEVARFINYLKFKAQPSADFPLAEKKSKLGGLWKGVEFTEEDIAQARREMWGGSGGEG
jgi:hypothetical protein